MQHSVDIDLESRGEATPFGRSIGRMLTVLFRPQMRRWRLRIALAFVLTVAAKGLAVIAPVFMGDGINQLTADGAARAAGMSFVAFFLLFATSRFLSNALPALRDAFFSAVTQDAQRIISVDAFAHAQKLDLQFHLTRRAGALNRVIERGASAMEYLLRFLAFNIGPTLIELCLASIVLAVRYGIQFSIAAVVTVVIYAVFTIVVTEWRNAQRRDFNEADTKLRGISIDTLSNFETVKSFAAEDRESIRFDNALRNYNKQYVRIMQSLSVLNGGQELIMTGGLLAVLIMAGHGVVNGNMQSGDVAAILFMLINIYRPLNILGWAWREIKQGSVDIEKLFNLMDMETNVPDKPGAMAFKPTGGHVQLQNVTFTHEGRKDGLQNVDIDIAGGNFVGVVGPSGAGKSTILKLLFRFYDPVDGAVIIDGQDIRDVNQVSLRTALGIVPQEVVLFNDTLRFNLAYAKPDASEEDIMSAARRAQLGEFIESLPEGLDTRVGERGLKLSGGEKQRVGIARAILLDPPILVLDEATSSLDSSTEDEVQTALREAAKGRTTLAVAHRLSTVANADMIVVLDGGRVIERGTHDELVASGGFYADLWARQSGKDYDAAVMMPSAAPPVV